MRAVLYCPRCHRSYNPDAPPFCGEDGTRLTDAPQVQFLRAKPTRETGVVLEGRYAILGVIGAGGIARVYLAEDVRTKRAVAVKIMNPKIALDPIARHRFLREIDVAASIRHPNVVEVIDAGERADGSPFIVLEFLHGESLGELLRRDEAVEAAFAIPMLARAASGLAAAHQAGVFHRDVKPDNLILVGERGAPYSLKVVDFGMAKLSEGSKITSSGTSLGTLAYIAPEQVLGDPVDGRTDVYGLGVVMYRMLTGRLPFDAGDDAMLVAQHLFVAPVPPRVLKPDLDPRLELIALRAMRKRPENRYSTMAAFVEDLERILGTRAGDVVPAPLFETPDLFVGVTESARATADALRPLVAR